MPILDQYGSPVRSQVSPNAVIARLRNDYRQLRAKYDAVADGDAFVNHWANADNLSPNAANSYNVRRKFRARSRYEVIENNPYLKGTILTIANDFVGSGPKLHITDDRFSAASQKFISTSNRRWTKATKQRQRLWRKRMAKITDGESFQVAFTDTKLRHPIKLNFYVVEADRISSLGYLGSQAETENEIDGVRFDSYSRPTQYHLLREHPGGFFPTVQGEWVSADYIIHWFRQDRGWLRGIPETAPSLPLCALLRRYTLAVVKAAETGADFAAVLESEAPPGSGMWTDGNGNVIDDSPFDTFPIEQGMFTTLPWGYKLSQLDANQPMQVYDSFVKALLMEIVRPLLVPFNIAAGSSANSNMASAVVDTHIYKESQSTERLHCDEEVLDAELYLWWKEFLTTLAPTSPDIMRDLEAYPELREELPEHRYRWDQIGLDHTDPQKVIGALATAKKEGFLLDKDIQETYHNRDVNEWREGYEEQKEWEQKIGKDQTESTEVPEEGTEEPEEG